MMTMIMHKGKVLKIQMHKIMSLLMMDDNNMKVLNIDQTLSQQ